MRRRSVVLRRMLAGAGALALVLGLVAVLAFAAPTAGEVVSRVGLHVQAMTAGFAGLVVVAMFGYAGVVDHARRRPRKTERSGS